MRNLLFCLLALTLLAFAGLNCGGSGSTADAAADAAKDADAAAADTSGDPAVDAGAVDAPDAGG